MTSTNILLVDDRSENLLALEAMLESLDPRLCLIKAHSGDEALKAILDQDFAAILLDVHMQGMDGFETAALIKEREKSQHTPIIFLTAYDHGSLPIFKGYSVGAVDYLIKPIVPEILRAKVAIFVDLYRAHQRLQELDQLKARFIADVSHQLRTPVANLELRLYMLEHDAEPKRTEHVAHLKKQLSALHDILQNIFKFADFQAQMPSEVFTTLDLNNILERVVNDCLPEADRSALDLSFTSMAPILPIYGNEAYLAEAFTQLVINAIRFTPNGFIHVWAQADTITRQIHLLVQDSGIGITKRESDTLFDVFYRGGDTVSDFPGIGLGLGLAKAIIDWHSGQIDVESAQGQGTTFRIKLPLHTLTA